MDNFSPNLRFADDIFLCTETPQELQQMLLELSDESRRMGLKMNIAKTKVMFVDNTPINVNNAIRTDKDPLEELVWSSSQTLNRFTRRTLVMQTNNSK